MLPETEAALIVVAPNSRLGRFLNADEHCRFRETVQLRSLKNVRQKLIRQPFSFLLLELSCSEIETALRELNEIQREFPAVRFGVFCPELAEKSVTETETITFSLLEGGATVVFTGIRELSGVLHAVRRHFDAAPKSPKDRMREIRDSLPWN